MFSILFLSKATKPPIDLYDDECESFDLQSFWDDGTRAAKQAIEPDTKPNEEKENME